jgi:hypothetical protein
MGTPHRGSPEENIASVVSRAAWATGRSPNDQLLRTLAEDSHILERQRLHFASITEYMATVCLFEEQPTPIPAAFGMVSRHVRINLSILIRKKIRIVFNEIRLSRNHQPVTTAIGYRIAVSMQIIGIFPNLQAQVTLAIFGHVVTSND